MSKAELSANWMELPARELPFQLLLLDKIADPSELIDLDPSLPSLVFGQLIRTEPNDQDQPSEVIPAGLAEVIAKAFPLLPGQAALDVTFGLGATTAAALSESPSAKFFAQEVEDRALKLCWVGCVSRSCPALSPYWSSSVTLLPTPMRT